METENHNDCFQSFGARKFSGVMAGRYRVAGSSPSPLHPRLYQAYLARKRSYEDLIGHSRKF